MSFRDPGSLPSPPPVRRRSPWLAVAVGIGILALVAFGFLGTLIYYIKAEANKPLDIAALQADFRDVPLYPGAKLDESMTKTQRGAGKLTEMVTGELKADQTVIGAWLTPESPSEVKYWYDRVMPPRGFQQVPQPEIGDALSMFYRNGKDGILVITQRAPQTNGMTIIIVQKLMGLRTDLGEDAMASAPPATDKKSLPAVGQGAVGTHNGNTEAPVSDVKVKYVEGSGKPSATPSAAATPAAKP